jgi:polyhydroxyalkanoate synthase
VGYLALALGPRHHVPFPGAAFRDLVEQLIRKNVLLSGSALVGDRRVALADARGDVLVAVAERDNVVPLPASTPAMELVGDPERREEMRLPGGHVTFGTGKKAVQVTQPRMAQWIIEHSDELPEPLER